MVRILELSSVIVPVITIRSSGKKWPIFFA